MNELDFSARPDETVKTINSWVSVQTRAKITELVNRIVIEVTSWSSPTPSTSRANGRTSSPRPGTREEDWYGPSGTIQVPTMHRDRWIPSYCEENTFQALELPYRGGELSMLIVLPRKKDGLAALEQQWAVPGTYSR